MNPYESPGVFVGRAWRDAAQGPSIVVVRQGTVFDITSKKIPTMRDLLEMDDPVAFVRNTAGEPLLEVDRLLSAGADRDREHLLAPIDLQAVKACGVTFARSMVERVIEERAAGNPDLAIKIRERISAAIGNSLRNLKAGSPEAARVKAALTEEGLWSQYLEVGIGPDAEIFSKAQVMSAVGHGADVGLHPMSTWNNPEPEIVLAVDSKGRVKGATLGNDVNLRDIEGRSALLLGKSKDNNASCSIGPFIRLFDESYSLEDVRNADLDLKIEGKDGYVLSGSSSMKRSAATRSIWSRKHSAAIISIQTVSHCSWARCSRRSKTGTLRVKGSPTKSGTSSPYPTTSSVYSGTGFRCPPNARLGNSVRRI